MVEPREKGPVFHARILKLMVERAPQSRAASPTDRNSKLQRARIIG
jgi:hypothetical protein